MMMLRLVPVLAVAAAMLLASPARAQTAQESTHCSPACLRAVHRIHSGCNSRGCARRVLHARVVRERRKIRRALRARYAVVAPYRGWLAGVRACESGGNYATNTGNGFYGAYQFTLSSWRAVGGWGMPNLASPAEQDYRAVRLLHLQGRRAWPVCG